jgi:arylsulfatase A
MKSLVYAFAIVLLSLVNIKVAVAAPVKTPPNIIFIMADDLGYGDLSCYGQSKFTTPNIDALATEGMRFTQFYSGSTVCAPTRSTIMSGQHTGHTRVRGNGRKFGEEHIGLKPEDVTIAEVLKNAGYATGIVGKWGLGAEGTDAVPTRKGFDFFYGFLDQHNAHFFYPPYLWKNETKELFPENDRIGMTGTFAHDRMTEEALGFVERNAEQPFFLYLAYTIPHAEMVAPKEDMDTFAGTFGEENPYTRRSDRDYGTQPQPKAAFAGMVTRLDRDIGTLMERLKTLGIDDNTLVIFTSDNGPHAEGGHDYRFFDSNGPLKGLKRDLYEGGIRVPFIVRWPGAVQAGTTSDHIGAHWDFFSTCLEVANTKTDAPLDGISFLPEITGKKQKAHEYLYWEFYEKNGRQAVRMGDSDPNSPLQLYNLSSDLGEVTNVADQYPEVVATINQHLVDAHGESKWFTFNHEKPKK